MEMATPSIGADAAGISQPTSLSGDASLSSSLGPQELLQLLRKCHVQTSFKPCKGLPAGRSYWGPEPPALPCGLALSSSPQTQGWGPSMSRARTGQGAAGPGTSVCPGAPDASSGLESAGRVLNRWQWAYEETLPALALSQRCGAVYKQLPCSLLRPLLHADTAHLLLL